MRYLRQRKGDGINKEEIVRQESEADEILLLSARVARLLEKEGGGGSHGGVY